MKTPPFSFLEIGDVYERDFACGDPFCRHWRVKPLHRLLVSVVRAWFRLR